VLPKLPENLDRFQRNLLFGARNLGKKPALAIATITTLALGSGVNTAVFSVTNALLLKPLAYREPHRLVLAELKRKDEREADKGIFTLARYELTRDHNRSFTGVAAATNDSANLSGGGEPLQVPIARVSPNFFDVLGVNPQFGRLLMDTDAVVVISDSLWRGRFGSDPGVIGRTVNLDGEPQTIVGVLPAGITFPFLGPAEVWSPRYLELSIMSKQRIRSGVGYLTIVARLLPGAGIQSAAAEMAVLNARYNRENPKAPDAGPDVSMTLGDLQKLTVADVRTALLLLTAAVGVILLISCANVANLLLASSIGRRKEFAVRAALGAGRGVLVGQMLTEGLLLTSLGGALGLLLSWVATRALVKYGASVFPPGFPIGIDWRVLLFTVAISAFAALVVGLSPALQLSRTDLVATLREEGRGGSPGRHRQRLNGVLVVAQIALSMVLLVGTGLLVHSFTLLLKVEPGFDPRNVLTANVSLPTLKYATPQSQITFFDSLRRHMSALPGVQDVAESATLPLAHIRVSPILAEGQPDVPLAERPFTILEAVSPGFFATMRIPLLSGRGFLESDSAQGQRVVVVNQALARRYWPHENPIGTHILVGRQSAAEIVGVAADAKNNGLAPDTDPQVYLPFTQMPWGNMNLLVRTSVDPRALAGQVRKQVAALDPDQAVTRIRTVDDIMNESRAQPRFTMFLLGFFSVVALVLAVIGVHGVLAYSVTQRRSELGIRLALGGTKAQLLRMVVGRGLLLTGIGIVLGLTTSLAITRAMASVLFKTDTRDVTTYAVTAITFLIIGLLASYGPARRATQIDPAEALRQD
jgi:putative ABC transport system permease protein